MGHLDFPHDITCICACVALITRAQLFKALLAYQACLVVKLSKYNILLTGIFAEKMWVAFANAKATHIFPQKY